MAQQPEEGVEGGAVNVEDIWNAAIKKPFAAQAVFFLNVFWEKHGNEKDDIFLLYLKFLEQQEKFGAKDSNVPYPQFCKVLQQLEESNERISEALKRAGDRSTMSKEFQKLGFKLRGDVTLLEGLLFLYGESVQTVCTAPQSPGDARLRAAQAQLASANKVSQDLVDKKAACEADIQQLQNENQPMKAIKKKQELAAIDQEINNSKVQRQKNEKAAQKEVKDAEANLAAENQKGTAASNWMKKECQGKGKQYHA